MKVVVWNMQQRVSNWDVLREDEELMGADIALVCEAKQAPGKIDALGTWVMEGLETKLPADKPVDRPWSTGVASGP